MTRSVDLSEQRPEPAPEPRRYGGIRRLVGEAGIYGIGGILARVAGVFLVPVYLAAAGTEAYGEAQLVIAGVSVTAIVLRLGIVSSMSRFTLAEGKAANWAPVLHTIYAVVLSLSTAAVIVGLVARDELAELLRVSEGSATIGVLGVWVAMNYDVLSRLYRIQRRAKAFVAFQLANVVITVVLTLLFVVVWDYGATGLLAGNFAGTAIVFVGMAWLERGSIGVRAFDRRLMVELLRYSLPLMPTAVAIWVLGFADRIQVQRLAGPLELGQYAAAAKVAAGMMVFLGAFQSAWTPYAHELRGAHGDEAAKSAYAEVFTFWAIAMGWSLAALTLLSAPYIALTFPADTQDAIPVVPLLAAAVVLYGAYLVVNIGVTMAKKTHVTPFIAAGAGAVTIGLNFWLIPELGIVGAGISAVIGFSLLVLFQWLNARRVYPVPYEWSRVLRVAAFTTGVLALSVWAIPDAGPIGIPLRLALAAAFPLGLLVLGTVSRDELRRVPSLWRRRGRRAAAVPEEETTEPAVP